MAIEIVDFPLKMVIFYSYVELPEGKWPNFRQLPLELIPSRDETEKLHHKTACRCGELQTAWISSGLSSLAASTDESSTSEIIIAEHQHSKHSCQRAHALRDPLRIANVELAPMGSLPRRISARTAVLCTLRFHQTWVAGSNG